MQNAKAVFFLLQKELQQELKQQNAVWVILLYVLSSVFVAYLSFKKIVSINTWNALFWIIILFAAFNATLRVFDKENGGRHILLSQLLSPLQIVLGKSLFASLLVMLVGIAGFVSFSILLGFPVKDFALSGYAWFFILIILAGIGLGFLLVLINGIAFKSGNSIGMATILGLPVAMPLIMLLLRVSQHILAGQPLAVFSKYLLSLTGLDAVLIVLSSLLFPYLWRD